MPKAFNLLTGLFLAGLLIFNFFTIVKADHIPGPIGYVNDFAQVLTSEQKNSLENDLRNYEQQTTNEISIVFIRSLDGDDIDDFVIRVFEEWKIGKKGKDNGILLLASIDDRKIRIEVGYGLEPYLLDSEAGGIIREVIAPEFKKQDYYTGTINAVGVIKKQLAGQTDDISAGSFNFPKFVLITIGLLISFSLVGITLVGLAIVQPKKNHPKWMTSLGTIFTIAILTLTVGSFFKIESREFVWGVLLIMGLIFLAMLLVYLSSYLARTTSIWAGGVAGGVLGAAGGGLIFNSWEATFGFGLGFTLLGLLLDWWLSDIYRGLKKAGKPTDWWHTGGGFYSGGSGFGGFGGGGSGGGGSSGSW